LVATVDVLGSLSDAVTWSSSAPAVASVSGSGVVEKHAFGSATITATSVADPSRWADVEVFTPGVTSVTINPAGPLMLGLARTETLLADVQVVGGVNADVVWSSSAPAVATVTADGVLTTAAYGVATVTATSSFDPSQSASVQVVVDPFAHCPASDVRYVDAAAPAGGDGSVGAPFTTLAAGITAAAAGDTVCVAAGAYPEPQIVINKAIAVIGPFAGVPGFDAERAGTNRLLISVGEAVLQNNLRLNANGASIDGFAVQSGGSLVSAAGLQVNNLRIISGTGDYPNHQTSVAITFSSAGNDLSFSGNYIRGWLTAIFVQGTSSNVTFTANRFEGNYTALSGDGTVTQLVYHANTFAKNHRSISYATSATTPLTITDNVFDNNTRGVMFRAVGQTGPLLTFTGNRFLNMTGETVVDGKFGGDDGSVIFDFAGSIAGTSLNGNWWGQATGPKGVEGVFNGQIRGTTDGLTLTSWCSNETCTP
jgi:hypothetical protein